jgi:CDP-glycerol glycerophosphotransferase (TagB/SpsB family)
VASFSFGAGNAAKLARVPLYAAGRLATILIPRGGEWVFGCAVGIADGALALWQVARDHGQPAVWLVATPQQARDAAALGIPSIPKHSLRGFWRTARARVVVVTHGFGDVNRYAVTGAFVVQLWHGIPLKRIGLDSAETLRPPAALGRGILASVARRVLRLAYGRAARRIRVLPAASHVVRARLESAFGLPDERIPVTGEPRVDVLSQGSPEARRAEARERTDAAAGPLDPASRLVLYAPTWRDGDPDPAVPTAGEWRTILDVLDRHDAVLLVRSHPLGAGEYRPPVPSERVRSLGSDVVADVTPLLPGLDALVTDYSSLIFDSSLVPLPVVFLAPDVQAYARRRGFYGTYAEVAGEEAVADWDGAAERLDALLGEDAARDAALHRARRLDARVHAYRDGGNTGRVYRAILAGLGPQEGTE